jgi:transposase InsO family protein
VVLEAFSRRIVGWAMAEHLRTDLVLSALNMALAQRRAKGVVHHSDQGTQYTSIEFGLRCKEAKVHPSMGTVGDAYDDALCENFFATLEREPLARRRLQTKAEARMAIFELIEGCTTRSAVTKDSVASRRSSSSGVTQWQGERAVTHRALVCVAGATREAPWITLNPPGSRL